MKKLVVPMLLSLTLIASTLPGCTQPAEALSFDDYIDCAVKAWTEEQRLALLEEIRSKPGYRDALIKAAEEERGVLDPAFAEQATIEQLEDLPGNPFRDEFGQAEVDHYVKECGPVPVELKAPTTVEGCLIIAGEAGKRQTLRNADYANAALGTALVICRNTE